ncbi:MAG: TraG family conjugative transposon ATPase [Bacteroidales bacterium]
MIRKNNQFLIDIEDNKFISNAGIYGIGLKLHFSEIYSQRKQDYELISDTWNRALRELPTGTYITKYDVYLKDKYKKKDAHTYLQNCTENYFEGKEFIKHECYIFFSYNKGLSDVVKNPFNFLRLKDIEAKKIEAENFLSAVFNSLKIIESSRLIEYTPLHSKEIQQFEDWWMNGFDSDQLNDLNFENQFVSVSDKSIGICTVTNERFFPETVSTERVDSEMSQPSKDYYFYQGFMDDLGAGLPCEHIYLQTIYISDHKENFELVKKNQASLHGVRKFSPENQRGADRLKEIIDDIIEDESIRLVHGFSTVIYWGKKEEFQALKTEIHTRFRNMDFVPKHAEKGNLKALFVNGLFMNVPHLSKDYFYMIELYMCTMLFINNTFYKDDPEGIILNDRIFNLPVRYDFWDRGKKRIKSRNFAIIAPTGSGKSVTANHIFRQLIEEGVKTVIVDLGDSYIKLAKLFPEEDVAVIKYNPEEPLNLNPFTFHRSYNELTDGDIAEKVEQVCEFVWVLIKRGEKPSQVEETSLRKIVKYFYDTIFDESVYSWQGFYDWLDTNKSAILRHLLIEDSSFFNIAEFLHNGAEFCQGGIYENVTKIEEDKALNLMNKKLIIFELDQIKDNRLLLIVMLQVISETIHKVIWSDKKNRGIVFFDEFAKQLKFPEVLDRVEYYAQAIRKQNGALGLVLQTINQLPKDGTASSIFDNMETFIFLETKDYKNDIEYMSLDLHDQAQLYSMRSNFVGSGDRYSEIYISRKGKTNVYRIHLAPELYLAYQTEGEIHTRIMELYKQSGSMQQAIETYKEEQL